MVNLRSRNCPAPDVEVVETSPSINPFYSMPEDELSELLSSRFSTLMVSEVIPKNKKRFRNFISKRDVVMKVLRKLVGLLKADAASKIPQPKPGQNTLLNFFSFKQEDVTLTQMLEDKPK